MIPTMKHTSIIALLAISLLAMATTACRDDEPELLRAEAQAHGGAAA